MSSCRCGLSVTILFLSYEDVAGVCKNKYTNTLGYLKCIWSGLFIGMIWFV